MILKNLGKESKGYKSFNLASADEFGYKLECSDMAGTVVFNNIMELEWLMRGKRVSMVPNPLPSRTEYDFSRYKQVIITKAKVKERLDFEAFIGD